MIRQGCYQPKRQLLGGIRTRKENAPFHGAHLNVTYLSVGDGDCLRASGKCVKLGNRTRAAQVDVHSIKDGVAKLAATANVLTTVNMRP